MASRRSKTPAPGVSLRETLIGAGLSPFADLDEHLKLEVVREERFKSGALAQILVPKR